MNVSQLWMDAINSIVTPHWCLLTMNHCKLPLGTIKFLFNLSIYLAVIDLFQNLT